MSSPEARGLDEDQVGMRDPENSEFDHDRDDDHLRQQIAADREMAAIDEREWQQSIDDDQDRGPTERPGLFEREHQRAMDEAARDRAERGDPDTARLVDNRDRDAAAGRFDEADSYQRLIDSIREPGNAHADRAPAREQGRTRDTTHREEQERRFVEWARGAPLDNGRIDIVRGRGDGARRYPDATRGRER